MAFDEVMVLSKEKLRIKAAELLGFTDIKLRYLPVPWLMDVCEDVLSGYFEGAVTVIPDYLTDIAAAMGLAESIVDRYWLELHTPFCIGEPYFAGFTPLGTTGWNGVPDNKCPGDKAGQAITRSFILTMEGDNADT